MEYAVLAISIVAVILCILILILMLKNKKKGDITLGDSELKKIRDATNESVSNISGPVSELVAGVTTPHQLLPLLTTLDTVAILFM